MSRPNVALVTLLKIRVQAVEHGGLISRGTIQDVGTDELLEAMCSHRELGWVLRSLWLCSAVQDLVHQSITGLGTSLLLHMGSKLKISAGLSLTSDFPKTSEQFLL